MNAHSFSAAAEEEGLGMTLPQHCLMSATTGFIVIKLLENGSKQVDS